MWKYEGELLSSKLLFEAAKEYLAIFGSQAISMFIDKTLPGTRKKQCSCPSFWEYAGWGLTTMIGG
jgi:hypothetical protein